MRNILSICLVFILFVSILIPVYATKVEEIEPDTNVFFVGVTDEDIPVTDVFYTRRYGDSVIIIPQGTMAGIYTNAFTGRAIKELQGDTPSLEAVESSNEEEVSTTALPNEDQSINYNIDHEQLIKEIFDLVNEVRKENNIPELTYNKEIQEVADIRAKEASELFSHTRPDGTSCHDAIQVEYYATGENLIKADKEVATAKNLMDSWMNSKSHRDNILLKDFTEMAVGVYEKDGVVYATQIFLG